MTPFVVAGAIAAAGSLTGWLGWAAWKMMHPREDPQENEGTMQEAAAGAFRPERYRPMERLLRADDFGFLQSQPGYTDEIGGDWKRGRRRIFRMYLDELKRDFHRLHARARILVADSGAESSELVGVLIRQQFAFWRAIALVELRLALAGRELPQLDIRPVVDLLDSMRLDLERLSPQAG